MGAVLGELAERGYGYAYRVLDAQHFGVPQRRRRVVIVANSSDWDAPAQVLLEPARGGRDLAPGAAPGTRLARVLGRSIALARIGGTAPTLQGGGRRGYRVDAEMAAGGELVPETAGDEVQNLAPVAFGRTNGIDPQVTEDQAGTLRAGHHVGGGSVMQPPAAAAAFAGQGLNPTAVRRLTPVECERLQGYPAAITWGDDLTKDEHIVAGLASGHIVVEPETGTVRRTRGPGGIILTHPKVIGGTLSNGYRVATLHVGGMRKQVRLNRVVWIAENGIPADGMVVCHRDNDKTNNAIGNLYLATGQQNSTDAAADGLYLSGDDNPGTKLPVAQRRTLCEAHASGATIREAAERFGVSKSRAHQIIQEEGWTATSSGKPQADSSRYRGLGNSIAVPVFEWVALGINEFDEAKESAQ